MPVRPSETESLTRKVALTDRSLQALKPAPAGKRLTVWDARMPGLAVRVTDKGRRSFYAVRRRAGQTAPTWALLGSYPVMSLADAREAGREALAALEHGKDPAALAEAKRREDARQRADLFEAVAENFAKRLETGRVRKVRGGGGVLRNAGEVAAIIRREFLGQIRKDGGWANGKGAPWRARPITEITRRDMREAIEAIAVRSPYAARHAFAAARRLFAHAVRQDLIEKSPCEGLEAVELHGAPAARDRVLTDDELRLVWRAAEAAGYPFGPLVKMLLLTGQRRDEIAELQCSEIEGALLTIPAERMKGGFVQTVPLVPAAVEILDTLPHFAGGDYAFSTMGGKRPVSGFSKMKARLDTAVAKLAGGPIAPWTLHDLRRTVRTGLSSVGVLPVIAELTIGHKQTGTSAIYDRHRYDDEKRTALEAWQKKLLAIVMPPPGDNVVPLRERATA